MDKDNVFRPKVSDVRRKNRPKTEKENTDISSTHQSIYPKAGEREYNSETQDQMDWMDEANAYRDLIMTNIEYDILCERHGEERMDEVVELMLEAVISKRPYIRIAGDEFPREIVRSRLLIVLWRKMLTGWKATTP